MRRRAVFWIIAIVLLLLTSFLIGTGGRSLPDAYDTQSAKPNGTKAMVELSKSLGAGFKKSSLGPANGVALIIRDDLTVVETERLEDWIASGGTLVIADLNSSFSTKVRRASSGAAPPGKLSPECRQDFVTGVSTIEPERDRLYTPIRPTSGAAGQTRSCFPAKDGYFVVEQITGLGRTIVVAAPEIFTNEQLGKADNSVLVANLLDMRDGQTVTMMQTAEPGASGTRSPASLIPDRARNVIWQLGIAGLLFVVWRWRRFGKPVYESTPVEIPASSLVEGVGSLMQAGNRDVRASAILREDLRRTLTERFGLPADSEIELIAQVTAQHTKIDVERIRAVLDGTSSSQGLVRLARQVETIRERV